MVGTSQVSDRSARSLRHGCRAVVLAWAVFLAAGVSDVHAQKWPDRVHLAPLWSKSTSLSLGWKYDKPLGADIAFPDPGETVVGEVRNWHFTGMVGAGVAIPNAGVDNTDLTVVGYAGIMRRNGWRVVERVGLATYVNLEPRAIGPALLGTVSVAEIMVGGLWVEGGDFVLALGLNLPLKFITDVCCR